LERTIARSAVVAGLLLSLPFVIAGCKSHGGSAADSHVRLIAAAPHQAGIRAVIEDHTLLGPVDYGAATDYRSFVPGRYAVRIVSDGGTVCASSITLAKKTRETVIVAPGPAGDHDDHLIVVSLSSEQADSAESPSVVFVNAAAGGRRVDILANSVAAAEDLAPGASSAPVRIGAGTYDIRAIVAGDPTDSVADSALIATSGKRYVCVLMGGRGEATVIRTYDDR
jgi:hypothetical protein